MAEYSKLITTNDGKALVAKLIAGSASDVDFTSIVSSSTQYEMADLESLTELTGIQQTSLVSHKEITNNVAIKLETAFTNTELTTGYYMRTIGLYAVDPDKGEILFAVAIETSGNCYMPPYNGVTVSGAFITLITTVGNADNVSLEVDPAAIATIGDIEELRGEIAHLNSTINSLNTEVADLQAYVGFHDEKVYGVDVDFKNKTFIRLAGAEGKTAGKDFDHAKPFGGRRRCNLTDDGVVVAYLGDDAYTESGALTMETTIDDVTYPVGTKVQVMVEQPKFYYKVVPVTLETFTVGSKTGQHIRRAKYYISETEREGFKLHPAFIENGHENDFIYLSAYEGSLWDRSANAYILDDAQVADFNNDLLCSIAGAKPMSGLTQDLTRANARKLAHNRGEGWEQIYATIAFMDVMLMLVEYASFNMQNCIGNGNVNKTDDSTNNMAENTGATANLGNASGAELNGNNIQIVTYRGEENIWGNIYKWLDGINTNNSGTVSTVYMADHDFADDTSAAPYEDTGLLPIPFGQNQYGYISAFSYSEEYDFCFIASEILGNSELPVGDYLYNHGAAGWHVCMFGSNWHHASIAGAVCLTLNNVSFHRHRAIGGRLVYIPSKKGRNAA